MQENRWIWPLKGCSPLLPDEPGRFMTARKFDVHPGIDLYTEIGTEVVAVEPGRVVRVEVFTGPNTPIPSPWWNHTQAVLVEGASGVVIYGEIAARVSEGDTVKQGDVVGVVENSVLRRFKGRPMVMLHIELMPQGQRRTYYWEVGAPDEPPMLDPEPYLLEAAGGEIPQFNLSGYDGTSFVPPHVKESTDVNTASALRSAECPTTSMSSRIPPRKPSRCSRTSWCPKTCNPGLTWISRSGQDGHGRKDHHHQG